MLLVTPTYRTDVLACPLNAGKLLQVRELVTQLRTTAGWEAKMQWQQFHRGRWLGFESMARKGWTRPWVTAGSLSTSYAQMVMSQVAGALTGHLGQVRNTYTQFVSGSSLPATARHQLHSLNRRSLWFNTSPVTVKQEQADKKGKLRLVTVVIPSEVMALARRLIRRARDHHRKPHFKRFQPQVDQRGSLGAEPDSLGILESWAPEARDFDSSVRAARPGESLQTLTLMFTRDLGGADDRLYEMDVVVPERAVEKCRNWINELIAWLEDENYGYAVTSWIRENETPPHATVGKALNDLVAQMVAADLSSHPWTEMLRREMRVAQAQKRVDNTPGWEVGSQEGPRRARARP